MAIGGVAKLVVVSCASVAPLSACVPAGTVTVISLACGKRGAAAVNSATRVSIQRQVPGTAGAILAGAPAAAAVTPTFAIGTIGSSKRTRTSDSARTSPCGRICGDASRALTFDGTTGASPTGLPVGTTNAI